MNVTMRFNIPLEGRICVGIMAKRSTLLLAGSGILIAISFLLMAAGGASAADIDVQANALFQGTDGTVDVQQDNSYSIFVNDQYTCSETTVTIYDDIYEYFLEDCDSTFNEQGWRHVGVMSSDLNGQLTVESNHEIIIVSDMVYLEEGGLAVLGGGALCCIGVIGLIVGIILASTNKGGNVIAIQQPMPHMYQQPMQQMHPQQGQHIYQQPTQQIHPQQGQHMYQQPTQQMHPQQGQHTHQQPPQQMQQQPMQSQEKNYIDKDFWDSVNKE